MKTADAPRERVIRLELIDQGGAWTANTQAPVDGETLPHITLPPRGADGEPCRGFALSLGPSGFGDVADPSPGGFQITIYKLIATLCRWAVWAQPTVAGLEYGQQFVSYDAGAGAGLYFRFGNVDQGGGETPQRSAILVMVAGLS